MIWKNCIKMKYQAIFAFTFFTVSFGRKYDYFKINPYIVGKTCLRDRVFTYEGISSDSVCAIKCKGERYCKGFFYSPQSNICNGCGQKFYYSDQLDGDLDGSVYYRATRYHHIQCPEGFVLFVLYCFKFKYDLKTFSDAVEACKLLDSYLVEVSSRIENECLKRRVLETYDENTTARWWMGLTDQSEHGTWRWQTSADVAQRGKTTYEFTDWALDNNEEDTNRHCVVFGSDGRWVKRSCDTFQRYICEHDGSWVRIPV